MPAGGVMLVLHAHLPYVRHPDFPEYGEESWLFEAMTGSYLPLLQMFGRLDDRRGLAAISLSPTLLEMFRDEHLAGKYDRYLDKVMSLAERKLQSLKLSDPDRTAALECQVVRLQDIKQYWTVTLSRNLVAAFVGLARSGVVELFTTAATHAYFPVHARDLRNVRRQIDVGLRAFRRVTGLESRGFWLPECGYFGQLDELLADSGVDFFFVDSHMIENASPRPTRGTSAPVVTPSGVAAFGRDEATSRQVWSAREGYPADPDYRDFHSDMGFQLEGDDLSAYLWGGVGRGMSGLKLDRVTGIGVAKGSYAREAALRKAKLHAGDFVRGLAGRLPVSVDRDSVIVAMYDAELFGHWWYEGPEFLEAVFRVSETAGVRFVTPSEYLAGNPVLECCEPAGGSWGAGGYSAMWINPSNDWIYPELWAAQDRLSAMADHSRVDNPVMRDALNQCAREVMLAEASDWPFMLTNNVCVGYAEKRVRSHLERFHVIANGIESGHVELPFVEDCRWRNPIFDPLDGLLGPREARRWV